MPALVNVRVVPLSVHLLSALPPVGRRPRHADAAIMTTPPGKDPSGGPRLIASCGIGGMIARARVLILQRDQAMRS